MLGSRLPHEHSVCKFTSSFCWSRAKSQTQATSVRHRPDSQYLASVGVSRATNNWVTEMGAQINPFIFPFNEGPVIFQRIKLRDYLMTTVQLHC